MLRASLHLTCLQYLSSLPLTLLEFVINLSNSDFLEAAFTFSEFKCLQNGFLTLEKYFLATFSGIRVVTPKLLSENVKIALIFKVAQITNQAGKLKKPAGISTKILQHQNFSEKQRVFNKPAFTNQIMSQQNIPRSPKSLTRLLGSA